MKTGKVFLVGAGPGNPELITVKGKRLLTMADVVLFDSLAHPSLLSWCKPEAKLVSVGKRKGKHSATQATIHRLMKHYATKGKQVVRLKGGDPMLFGRGGEELAYLHSHGIAVEVVPGVTSALAVPAYLGVSVTHREASRSVAVMTGTLKKGESWASLQVPVADTLVILMGVTVLPQLVDKLLSQPSYSPQTPIAVMHKGTLAAQRWVSATLGTICETCQDMGTPSLVVVGQVVALAEPWVHALPLSGKRMVLLRPSAQARAWAESLEALGAEPVIYPLLRSVSLSPSLSTHQLAQTQMLIFTSETAVKEWKTWMISKNWDLRLLAGKQVVSVGPKTTLALQECGLFPDIQATLSQQEGIVEALEGQVLTGTQILFPCAKGARPFLTKCLEEKGAIVRVLPLYETRSTHPSYWPIEEGDYVWFTSASTVEYFFKSKAYVSDMTLFACAIGAQTAEALTAQGITPHAIAKAPTFDAMVEAILCRQ